MQKNRFFPYGLGKAFRHAAAPICKGVVDLRIAASALALIVGAGCATAQQLPATPFSHLRIDGHTVQVQNATAMTVSADARMRLSGPHHFTKQEDNGYHFEVSLASYVEPHVVVSVAAERLVESSALGYEDLPAARWPDPGFLTRASGCTTLTPEQAAAMPEQSGMKWILEAGFVPGGAFAYEAALLLAPDRRHEATIELMTSVASCDDPAAIESALKAVRGRVSVSHSTKSP